MPDGFRVDELGNVWAVPDGRVPRMVQIFAPDGDKIGAIHLPEGVSNLCFGGLKRNRLFNRWAVDLQPLCRGAGYALYVKANPQCDA